MLYNCSNDTPWGPLAARFSDEGLVEAWFPGQEDGREHADVAPSGQPQGGRAPAHRWAAQLDEAVDRFLTSGAVSLPLDLTRFPSWTQDVYRQVLTIPPGQTTTYGALARATGRPEAARAVGAALSRQPYAFFLPTHRVWPTGGGPGWCTSGAGHLRLELLRREGLI